VVVFKPKSNIDKFSMSLLGESAAASGLALQVQQGLILVLVEEILRCVDLSAIGAALALLDSTLPTEHSVDLDALQPDDKGALPNGWFAQPWIDVQCLRVCGLVLALKGTATAPRAVRLQVVEIMSNFSKVSSRVKCHLKFHMNGAHVQPAKLALDAMQRIAKEHDEQKHMDETFLGTLEARVVELNAVTNANKWDEIHDFIVDLIDGHSEDIAKFGKVFGGGDGANQGDEDADAKHVELVRDLTSAVLRAASIGIMHWLKKTTLIKKLFRDCFRQGAVAWLTDAVANDQEEDCNPAELQDMQWISAALSLLLTVCQQEDVGILKAANARVDMCGTLFHVWSNFVETGDAVDTIGKMADMWQACTSLEENYPAKKFSIRPATEIVQRLVETLTEMQDLKSIARRLAVDTQKPGAKATTMREWHDKRYIFPAEVGEVIDMVAVLNKVDDAAARGERDRQFARAEPVDGGGRQSDRERGWAPGVAPKSHRAPRLDQGRV
jgi:hypothetical protein